MLINSLGYEKLGYVPEKLYHFTLKSNAKGIYEDKTLFNDIFGYVYLTETLHDAEIFANFYAVVKGIKLNDLVIIELDTKETDIKLEHLYKSTDHNPDFIPVEKAIAYNGEIRICKTTEYNFN